MAAPRWLAVVALLVAGSAAVPDRALADQRALTVLANGLPSLGASLDEVRAMPLPEGRRLLCGGDDNMPRLADPTLLEPLTGRASGRIRFCTVVALAEGSTTRWSQAEIPSLAGPARLWLVLVEQGGGGRYRLARVSLWAGRDAWDKVVEAVTALLGPPSAGGAQMLGWEDAQHETLMFLDPKDPDSFAIAVADLHLRKLLRSPGAAGRAGD